MQQVISLVYQLLRSLMKLLENTVIQLLPTIVQIAFALRLIRLCMMKIKEKILSLHFHIYIMISQLCQEEGPVIIVDVICTVSVFQNLLQRTTQIILVSFLSDPVNHFCFSGEFFNLAEPEFKTSLTAYLTTWTEWSSCSPFCKRSRHRVCSGDFQCYEDDGTLCDKNTPQVDGNTCEAQHEACSPEDSPSGECFADLKNNRMVSSDSLKYCYQNEYRPDES